MTDADQIDLTQWNLREFPADLKRTLKKLAIDKCLKDSEIVAHDLRKGLAAEEQESKKKRQ